MLPRFNADVQSIILFQGRQPAITETVAAFMVLAVRGICACIDKKHNPHY